MELVLSIKSETDRALGMTRHLRLTPTEATRWRHRQDSEPMSVTPKRGRAPRAPTPAAGLREPSRLLQVEIAPPKIEGGDWTVKAIFSDGAVTCGCSTETAAQALQARIEKEAAWKDDHIPR